MAGLVALVASSVINPSRWRWPLDSSMYIINNRYWTNVLVLVLVLVLRARPLPCPPAKHRHSLEAHTSAVGLRLSASLVSCA